YRPRVPTHAAATPSSHAVARLPGAGKRHWFAAVRRSGAVERDLSRTAAGVGLPACSAARLSRRDPRRLHRDAFQECLLCVRSSRTPLDATCVWNTAPVPRIPILESGVLRAAAMSELHLPWLELALVCPLIGALWTSRLRDVEAAYRTCITFALATLIFAVGAWRDFNSLGTLQAHDRWDVMSRVLGP